jgi:hypothetical protein
LAGPSQDGYGSKIFALRCEVMFFLWFLIENLKCILPVLTLVKNLERGRALFYPFSGLDAVIRKRNPPGVDFKPFSRLPKNEKIAERLAIFTLVKVFEFMHPPSDSLTLFRSRWIVVRKRH